MQLMFLNSSRLKLLIVTSRRFKFMILSLGNLRNSKNIVLGKEKTHSFGMSIQLSLDVFFIFNFCDGAPPYVNCEYILYLGTGTGTIILSLPVRNKEVSMMEFRAKEHAFFLQYKTFLQRSKRC